MKRIFSMLAVLAILFVISVPLFAVSVSAADDDTDELSGYWRFNDTLTITTEIDPSVNFTTIYNGDEIQCEMILFSTNYKRLSYMGYFDSTTSKTNMPVYENGWKDASFKTIYITSKLSEVSKGSAFLTWLKANATKVNPCDGTTCPATDVNMDNICDDCGMTFSVLRDYTPSDFPSNYPPVPSLGNPNARYYLYRVISSNITYIVAYPSTVTPTYDSTKQNGQLYFSESYGNYRLDKTNWEWVLSSDESPYTIGGNNSTSVENLYSSVQIKDEKGENFFPIPLWEKVQEVTQREIPSLRSIVLGTIQILLLCGVGLMASLMVLNLFGKVFKTYRR